MHGGMRGAMRPNTGEWQHEATAFADDPVGFAARRGAHLLAGDVVVGCLYLDVPPSRESRSQRWPWRARGSAHMILWIEIADHRQRIWLTRDEATEVMSQWDPTVCIIGELAFTCRWMDASGSEDLRRALGITSDADPRIRLATP